MWCTAIASESFCDCCLPIDSHGIEKRVQSRLDDLRHSLQWCDQIDRFSLFFNCKVWCTV
jgi:hypothetical protein